MKIFLGILCSSILSRLPNQLILCPFIHFPIFYPLLISSSSRFVRLFHSPFPYLGPYILLNTFLSKISTTCYSFFVNVHAPAPHDTTGLIRVLYNKILVALDTVICNNVSKSYIYKAKHHDSNHNRILHTIISEGHVKFTTQRVEEGAEGEQRYSSAHS